MSDGLIVDNFAGGGGASTGIEMALGRSPTFAINHYGPAMIMHRANHPKTIHFTEDVWKIDPEAICLNNPVDLAWFSPDCTHHSKAKGGQPRNRKIRGLAWVVIRWAKAVRPKVIILENVEEFRAWGPLLEDNRPCPDRKGEIFAQWANKLRRYGYQVEWRELRACDYGVPTTRKRLFVIARRDGNPIVWPDVTHGDAKGLTPFKTAADCIDWSQECPSIFEPRPKSGRALKEKTLRRIARGVIKYVLEDPNPFVLPVIGDDADGSEKIELSAPTLIQTGYGERKGQAPRTLDLHRPLGTVVTGGGKHALVSAFLAKHYSETNGGWNGGSALNKSISTITTRDHHSLVATHLLKYYGSSVQGVPMDEPMHTVTTKDRVAEVRALLKKYSGHDVDPVVKINGETYIIDDIGMRMLTPRELYRAQGFPEDYIIDPIMPNGKVMSKTNQIEMVGNSVCPPLAAAIVRANCVENTGKKRRSST